MNIFEINRLNIIKLIVLYINIWLKWNGKNW